jgi:hypothetical protein
MFYKYRLVKLFLFLLSFVALNQIFINNLLAKPSAKCTPTLTVTPVPTKTPVLIISCVTGVVTTPLPDKTPQIVVIPKVNLLPIPISTSIVVLPTNTVAANPTIFINSIVTPNPIPTNPKNIDCMGVPNGQAIIDLCGVCGGNNSSCRDCEGSINGTKKLNSCGICGENDTSCVPDVKILVDDCGVLGGDNLCLDCAGVPNGKSKIDCCGICGGDGNSCPELCTFYDTRKDKRELRKGLKYLTKGIRKYSLRANKCKGNNKRLSSSNILLNNTYSISVKSEELLKSYVLDRVKSCDTQWCKKTDLLSVTKRVRKNLEQLYKLNKEAQYSAIKYCGTSTKYKNSSRLAEANLMMSKRASNRLPEVACVN